MPSITPQEELSVSLTRKPYYFTRGNSMDFRFHFNDANRWDHYHKSVLSKSSNAIPYPTTLKLRRKLLAKRPSGVRTLISDRARTV